MRERLMIGAFEEEFRKTKAMAEKAMLQVGDEALHAQINPRQNSVAVIVQHVGGNLLSRFTDFLISDGEKPSRDRDSEFVETALSRAELMELWERGWGCLFETLEALVDADMAKVVTIRREPHTVLKALVRASSHMAWHASQVALIAKHLAGEEWKYLTIAPKGTAAFNRKMGVGGSEVK